MPKNKEKKSKKEEKKEEKPVETPKDTKADKKSKKKEEPTKKKKKASSSEEESSSSEESSSEEEEKPKKEEKKGGKKEEKKPEPKKAAKKDSSSEESSSSEEEEEEKPKKEDDKKRKREEPAKAAPEKKAKSSSEEESSSEEDSDESSSSEDEEEESKGTKRKQEESEKKEQNGAETPAKKAKVDETASPAATGKEGTVFVGNLSWNTTEDALWEFFNSNNVGGVKAVRIITERDTGRSKGYGYVEVGDADAAVKLKGSNIDGREINVDHANAPPSGKSERRDSGGGRSFGGDNTPKEPSTTVFLGNLSFDSNEDSIRSALEQFGGVTEVRLVYDRESNRPRGFGYAEFADTETAKKAVEQSEQVDIDGRFVRMDFANSKRSGGGGGGGSGFGGGGRGGFGGRGRGGPRGGRGGFGSPRGGSFAGTKTTFD